MKQYLVVGNGIAAAGCIEGIRSVDKSGAITVISEEKRPVYCRPLISYYLEGKTDLSRINYRADDFYSANGCTVLYGRSAVSLDSAAKKLTLDNGKVLSYDSVCIACGSSPFVPKTEGLEKVKNSFTFLTLDETLKIEKHITEQSRVLIVGAGLIGLKCAEGLAKRVKSIAVCDLSTRVLSSILDDECAALMQTQLENNGITFMLGDTVERFENGVAHMKSGAATEFDLLITAIGVRPRTSLVSDCGGTVGRGIITDTAGKTSLKDVYAAGDCTESMDISSGERKILALLPNAYMQGRCAGKNMAGEKTVFDNAIPMNSIGFFGLHAMTAGSYFTPDEGGEMYEEKSEGKIKRLFSKNGVLTGFILIGDVDRAGIYTRMIREKTPLSEIDFEAIKKSPALVPFGSKYREKVLGGVV